VKTFERKGDVSKPTRPLSASELAFIAEALAKGTVMVLQ